MIGKVIMNLLQARMALTDLVPVEKIFPYTLNEGTVLPAIVYSVDSVDPVYNKDGFCYDEIKFSVTVLEPIYGQLQAIAYQIRKALELKRGTLSTITYNPIYLAGQVEGFSITEDVYLNKQTFTVQANYLST
jgi:hypothetical protein